MKRLKFIVSLIAIGSIGLLTLGCDPDTNQSGVVTSKSNMKPGARMPQVRYMKENGDWTSLNQERQPVAIIAFVDTPSGQNPQPDGQLEDLAGQYVALPVSVVQVSAPADRQPSSQGCKELITSRSNMILLCDSQLRTWEAFQQPEDGTIFLVDENSEVVDVATIGSHRQLAERAEDMGESQKRLHRVSGDESTPEPGLE
jgi:hypothetical protein